ncbi:MAG: amidohydrolase family protein [Candidatus Methanomethylophilaceae archaeon]|nr:amidohydrolase family protein [Candidatus Methanomethylophilaceae archaeon]
MGPSGGSAIADAYVYSAGSFERIRIEIEDGFFHEADGVPSFKLALFEDVTDAHTHCADYGLSVPPGMSIEELVAPPDGLKHRYLRDSSKEILSESMSRFAEDARAFGCSAFVDFREGGAEGCRLLKEACPEAVVLGRPVSPEFDPGEVEDILRHADGIGLPSISDMPSRYVEQVADAVRERGSILAIHASERVREDIDAVLSLDPAFVVHMCEASDSDLLKCAEAEVPVVACPGSNMYFGKVPPLARMQDMGVDIALGTDNGMLRPPDMAAEASLFVEVMESQGGDPAAVFGALSILNCKILNRNIRIGGERRRRFMAVPFEGVPEPGRVFRRGSSGTALAKRGE